MAAPSQQEVEALVWRTFNWVASSRRPAPQNDGVNRGMLCMSMYRTPPLTTKIPPGYTVAGFNACHYVRHAGSETVVNGITVPSITVTANVTNTNYSIINVDVGPWPDNQPTIRFTVRRDYNASNGRTTATVTYYGKPAQDTRMYPIQLYWGNTLLMADHRRGPGIIWSGYWTAGNGQRSNKYYIRSEDLLALYLCEAEPWAPQLNAWCSSQWGNVHANIYACMFNKGLELSPGRIYDFSGPLYADCQRTNLGCPNGWPDDMYRGQSSAGWGATHRSKTCNWPQLYTWVLAQDPLGLMSQAIHTLAKTNNPWQQFTSHWPVGVPNPPASMTPIGVAEWVRDRYYRSGIGVHMFNLPVIGTDYRASSMRTNEFSILCTLLGYRYLVGNWSTIADELAIILRDTNIGYINQPAYGAYNRGDDGNLYSLCRPDYNGAQLMLWDKMSKPGHPADGKMGLAGHASWLREFLDYYYNLPPDDVDYILSSMETTALCCQALRVYAYHKYGWLFGYRASIPG
jgi:hypothetical protein